MAAPDAWAAAGALMAASAPASRHAMVSRSPEGWFAVPASLQLKEAVGLGDEHEAVPELSGRLTAGRWGDDRTEQGRASDPQNRRPDVQADLAERFVVRVLDELVELSADRGCS